MTQRPLRFGYQLSIEDDVDPIGAAIRAESLGFDTVLLSDHVGSGVAPSPMPTLGAIAQATERIRVGTLVLNNEMRNPVQLAWEATTLDRLSGGRFELGLGVGHTPQEWDLTGINMQEATVRKERLAESGVILRRLFDGERVDFEGNHYQISGAEIEPTVQDRLPILIGGNGRRLLGHAGAYADIIGLQGLGRTLSDGHSHSVRWTEDWLTEQVEQVKAGAGSRFDAIELNALVQIVEVTNDRERILTDLCDRIKGLVVEDAATMPYLMVGSVDEIVTHIRKCRERWGISYFVVRDPAFAPVIAAV